MFNCVRPPEQQQRQQGDKDEAIERAVGPQDGQKAAATAAAAAVSAPPGRTRRCRPPKLRVRLRLLELAGCTLSNGVLFVKVRLLGGGGGRFCQHSEHREIRDNQVSWADQPPMEFACRLGPGAPPAHLRLSVRREDRGGRSSSKLGYAVLDIGDLPWLGDTEHSCILSPYSQGQRLDNSTLRLSLHPQLPPRAAALFDAASSAGVAAAAAAGDTPEGALEEAIGPVLPASSSTVALTSLVGGHRRNASNFSACSVRTHSRNNSLEQPDVLFSPNSSSQSSSVPSFDVLMPSSLERRRTGLTPTRELSSRIANTRTDNFQIVKEVLEREGILVASDAADG